jgi:iron complex transport system substrate-binding protein
MRSIRAPGATTLLPLLLAAAAAAAGPGPAKRVISLNPSLTSILVALGAGGSLIAVDDFSARQEPGSAGLPRVGGLYDPSLEAVVALHPDLVVLVPSAQQRDFRAQLRTAGIAVLELDPKSFDDVLASIETLGERVGRRQEAGKRVAEIRRARAEVERAASARPHPRTVLVLQRDPLYVAGPGSFIDEMLRAAGADNVAAGLPEAYPRAGLEWLLASAPEVILDAASDPEPAVSYWSRWSSLPAVRSGRVIAVDAGLVTLPGPQLDRALRAVARALEPIP